MATLRFSFGTMGSGKSTVALQIHHNLASRGLRGLLLTRLDRDGTQVTSRLGVAAPAVEVNDEVDLFALAAARAPLDYLVCDEAQFYAPAQCDQLARVVDELGADVYAFGLITDFRGLLFEGTNATRPGQLTRSLFVNLSLTLQAKALGWQIRSSSRGAHA